MKRGQGSAPLHESQQMNVGIYLVHSPCSRFISIKMGPSNIYIITVLASFICNVNLNVVLFCYTVTTCPLPLVRVSDSGVSDTVFCILYDTHLIEIPDFVH